MANNAAHREIACAVIERHGAGAAAFARRWASHNRSFGDVEAASLWAAVADIADTLLEGHRLAIDCKTVIVKQGPSEKIEGDSLAALMQPA
jgi:hypothetical protein